MTSRFFIIYVAKFIAAFCLLYFGTKAIIGLTVPGGYYNSIIADFFNYPSVLRSSLLNATRLLVGAFGYDTYLSDPYHVKMVNGRGIHLVYACLGYGLISFWLAFVFANKGNVLKKLKWMFIGTAVIWVLNVLRISIFLIAANKNWRLDVTMEHHTIFNLVVYVFIFLLIYLFHRADKPLATLQG